MKPPPVGDKIAIAGRVWVVEEVDHKRREVYCTRVKGNIPAYFGDVAGDIHTRILERMYRVLQEQKIYPYLMRHAVCRLEEARETFRKSGMEHRPLVHLGGNMWALFPWLGSYSFLALERFLKIRCARRLELKGKMCIRDRSCITLPKNFPPCGAVFSMSRLCRLRWWSAPLRCV